MTVPLSHLELYWAVRRGGMPPRLLYMTGSRPEKSMTVAAYNSPLSVTTAVELWRGSYGQRATPFTRSSTLLMLPTWNKERCEQDECWSILRTLQLQTCAQLYLSGNTQRLKSIRATGHDFRLVHQQDSDVVLTFSLDKKKKKRWNIVALKVTEGRNLGCNLK